MRKLPFRYRLAVGFLVAPLLPGVVVVIVGASFNAGKFGEALWLLKLSALVGYSATIVVGTPAYFVLRWRQWNGVGAYLVTGALAGISFSIAVVLALQAATFAKTIPAYALFSAICGAAAAAFFWVLVRPDRAA